MLPSSSNQPPSNIGSTNMQENPVRDVDIRGLITDAFGFDVQNLGESSSIQETVGMFDGCTHTERMHVEEPIHTSNDETARYHTLMKDADEELYPDCTKFFKISFFVHLFHKNI